MNVQLKKKEIINSLPKARGIYIAMPTGKRLRPFDKTRTSALINEDFIKIGKANNFKQRCQKYVEDNDGEIIFESVIITDHLTIDQHKQFENVLKDYFKDYRVRNPSGYPTEWLHGIEAEFVRETIKVLFNDYEKAIA